MFFKEKRKTIVNEKIYNTPDFITFFCHQIADIENQSFSCNNWVN